MSLPRSEDPQETEIHHLNGVPWWEAPIPHRWHKCKLQSYGWLHWFTFVGRCACGAITSDNKFWIERNSRRKK